MDGFKADVDKMQSIIDGELRDTITHFSNINDRVQAVSNPRDWVRQDNLCDLAAPYGASLGHLIATYKDDFGNLVKQLVTLGADLQHVVDLYRNAERTNTENIVSVGSAG